MFYTNYGHYANSYEISAYEINRAVGKEKIYAPKDFKKKGEVLILFKDPNSGKFMIENEKDFEKSGINKKRTLGNCYDSIRDFISSLPSERFLLFMYKS